MKTKIKVVSLILGCFLLLSSPGIAASAEYGHKNIKEIMRREIIRNIGYPEFLDENDATNEIKAIVQVDEAGQVRVVEINSPNPPLRDYVQKELEGMKIKTSGLSDKFVLVIKFSRS